MTQFARSREALRVMDAASLAMDQADCSDLDELLSCRGRHVERIADCEPVWELGCSASAETANAWIERMEETLLRRLLGGAP